MLSKVAILSLAAAALATADPPSYGGSPGWGDDKPDGHGHGDWSSSVAPSPPAYSLPSKYEPSTPVEPTEHKPSSYGSLTSTWSEEPSSYSSWSKPAEPSKYSTTSTSSWVKPTEPSKYEPSSSTWVEPTKPTHYSSSSTTCTTSTSSWVKPEEPSHYLSLIHI